MLRASPLTSSLPICTSIKSAFVYFSRAHQAGGIVVDDVDVVEESAVGSVRPLTQQPFSEPS